MDNITHAIFLAFAMFAIVLGLSYSIYLINSMNSVSSTLIKATDATSDYQTIGYDSREIGSGTATRTVGIDTVISTLYGYNQESYSIEIRDNSSSEPVVQLFDLTVENRLVNPDINDPEYNAYAKLYGPGKKANMYGAPWIVNPKYVKQRVDMYISGKKGYMNGTIVDYTETTGKNKFPNWVRDNKKFSEQFIQYTYDGDTITTDDGIETIVDSRRAQNKILIIYTLLD